MIINENNIEESVRVMRRLKDGILEGKEDDAQYALSPREELGAVVEIFVCLEMNDRYANPSLNKPSEKQLAYAYDLAKNMKDNAKTALAEMGKKTIDELTKDEISVFIKKLSGRN